MKNDNAGENAYALARTMWSYPRSLTGDGVRRTLQDIKFVVKDLSIIEITTGTQVFDWTIPKEWNIRDGYILTPDGVRMADFKKNNLHILGYSVPVNKKVSSADLKAHLYTLPDQPDLIPYVTSYYKERWGFCVPYREYETLPDGEYHVFIDSELKDGHLTYGEIIIPGKRAEQVFFSTYICHPSMANNELSGPCLATVLIKHIQAMAKRELTYRFIFIPETIGAIAYLSKNLEQLQRHVIAGFNLSCVGDNRTFSYLPSLRGETLADRVALNALRGVDYQSYSFTDRGSDERQYCYPGVDLPVCSIMRSKYGTYPEYHTSADDMSLVSPAGFQGAYDVYVKCIDILETNQILENTGVCEPQLGKRGLYPTISTKTSAISVEAMMNLLAYSDGKRDLLQISDITGHEVVDLAKIADDLVAHGLLKKVRDVTND